MPKENIHPKKNLVTYSMLDGSKIAIPSCYSKSQEFTLEIDIFNHVAWRKDKQYVNESLGNVAKFKSKFQLSSDAFSNAVKKDEK
jgi:ribosomal protein L31